jgi:uncharacterized protein
MAANNQGNQGTERERDSEGQFTSGGRGKGGGGGGQKGGGSGSGGGSRSEAARKGGEAVSKDREHMAEIGRKGGQN